MSHLTDDELLGYLEGEASRECSAHLEACAQCREEAQAIGTGVARYALAVHRLAGHAEASHRSGAPAPRRRLLRHRLSWAAAGALAVILAAQGTWTLRPRPQGPNSASQPAIEAGLSDDELLEAIHNDLSRDVPRALAPVSAITVERNRIAALPTQAATRTQD